MDNKTRLIIKQKLDTIYKLVDQIVEELNQANGIKICYPVGRSQEEVESALIDFAESKEMASKF